MDGKTLVRFNIKNAKYALKTSDGYSAPVAFGYSDSIALEADYSEKVIYGDGLKVAVLPNDKGKTGRLSLLTIDDAYEIAMKRRMKTNAGTVEIKQTSVVEHAVYFETEYMDTDGVVKTAKTWMYGVTSGKPSENFNQTTDDINNNNVEYALTIKGISMKAASGSTDAKDSNGNAIIAWQKTCVPGDTDYESFGDSCVIPRSDS